MPMHAKKMDRLWLFYSITLPPLTLSSQSAIRYSPPRIRIPSPSVAVATLAVFGAPCTKQTAAALPEPVLLVLWLFSLLLLQIRSGEFPTSETLRGFFDLIFVTDLLNSPSARVKTLKCLLHLLGARTVSPKAKYAPNCDGFKSRGTPAR